MDATCTLKVRRVNKCSKIETVDLELIRTCNCTVLIDGRQVSILRTVPHDLELLGIGHTLVSGYRPDTVHVFQASESDYIVNTLTLGRAESYVYGRKPTSISRDVVWRLYEKYGRAGEVLHRAVAVTQDGAYICDVEDVHITGLIYRLVGSLYVLKRSVQEIIVFLTCNVDEDVLQSLSTINLVGIVTTGKVTCNAVEYSRKNNLVLVGDFDPASQTFVIYSGDIAI